MAAANIATVFATWFGAETVLSVSATFAKDGLGGIVAEISRLRAENTALAAERDAERAARRDYESCITLETSCIGCARLLSACRTAEERAEKAEAALVAAQPALQLEAIRAGRIRCEGCGLIVVGGHLACGCCPRCCVCFALEAPHG